MVFTLRKRTNTKFGGKECLYTILTLFSCNICYATRAIGLRNLGKVPLPTPEKGTFPSSCTESLHRAVDLSLGALARFSLSHEHSVHCHLYQRKGDEDFACTDVPLL